MAYETIQIQTDGEGLYPFTDHLEEVAAGKTGILFLFCRHTSCALLISENYDPTARQDLESFFKYLAPRDLPFIRHTLEGEDDSPSHMKAAVLHQHLAIPIEKGELLLGSWQGIFLAEFRDAPKKRQIIAKVLA